MSAYELYLALQKQAAEDSADRPYLAGAAAGSALGGFTGAMHGLLGREEAGLAAVSQAEHQDYRNLRAAYRDLIIKGPIRTGPLGNTKDPKVWVAVGPAKGDLQKVIGADSVGELSEALQEQYRKHPAHAKFRAAANAHVGSRAGIGAALGLGTGLALAHFAGRDKQAAEGDEQSSGGHPYLAAAGGGLLGAGAGYYGAAFHEGLRATGRLPVAAEDKAYYKDFMTAFGDHVHPRTGAPVASPVEAAEHLAALHPERLKATFRKMYLSGAGGAAAGIAAGLGANYLLAGRDKRAAELYPARSWAEMEKAALKGFTRLAPAMKGNAQLAHVSVPSRNAALDLTEFSPVDRATVTRVLKNDWLLRSQALQKQAAVAQLPVEIEHPYEFAAQGVGEAAVPGLGWGAGIGAVGGLALGRTPLSTLGGAAIGGLLGAAVTGGAREAENWNRHAALVRAYEAQHGTLPYELSRPRQAELMARTRGQLVGAAADVALSGGLSGDRTGTYGLGTMIGGSYGSASAREQFERALIAHKRQMEQAR